MSNGNEIFGTRLKALRLERGLSQKHLGILAGIDEFVASTRINRYEQAVHRADYSVAQRLAESLNAPAAYFYADDENLAEMLLIYHRTSMKKKREILKFIEKFARPTENSLKKEANLKK